MKRKLLVTILACVGFVSSYYQANADSYPECRFGIMVLDSPLVVCNSKQIRMEAAPCIKEGHSMVPIKFLEYSLGAEVSWDESEQCVQLKLDGHVVKIKVGDKNAVVDGKNIKLDIAPELVNGRTMVPLRFIGEQLGARVGFYSEYHMIEISKFDIKEWKEYRDLESGLCFKYPSDYKIAVDKTVVTMTTRCGNKLIIKRMTGNYASVAKHKRAQLTEQGWDVYSYKPMVNEYGFEGITMNADTNSTPRDYYDSYFFTTGNYVYSWEFKAIDSGNDMRVEDWITSDMLIDANLLQQ